jgi:hypothetical protein
MSVPVQLYNARKHRPWVWGNLRCWLLMLRVLGDISNRTRSLPIYFDSLWRYKHSLDSARGIRPNTVINELYAKDMNLIRFCIIVFSLHSARKEQVIVSAVLAELLLTLNKYKQKTSEYMEGEGVRERTCDSRWRKLLTFLLTGGLMF